ncbi:MAG: DUF904 domain-containing protein [Burkholderiaceae bacterium]
MSAPTSTDTTERTAPGDPAQEVQRDLVEQLAQRVERLLVRYQELLRTNALLSEQAQALALERDSLKSRLGAARARVDALLQRLPEALPEPRDGA